MKECDSTITRVTVYTDMGALVSRLSVVQLGEGQHVLTFPIGAIGIEKDSIQVKGAGNAILRDVKLVKKSLLKAQHEEVRPLNEKRDAVLKRVKKCEKSLDRLVYEQELLNHLAYGKNNNSTKQQGGDFEPEKWAVAMDFYCQRLETIEGQRSIINEELLQVRAEETCLDKEIERLNCVAENDTFSIEVIVEVQEAGKMHFELSYLARGARWHPSYDIRVCSKDSSLQLLYNGIVTNSSGERWEEVELSLSSAKPSIGSKPPKLEPWFLFPSRPNLPMLASMHESSEMMSKARTSIKAAKNVQESLEEFSDNLMTTYDATVEVGSSSTVFNIAGKTSVMSDNQQQRVTLFQEDFRTKFYYVVVPSRSHYAYLKAEVENETDFPLLEGCANVFIDNHFVATSQIDFVPARGQFELDLGVDEAISVEYKKVENFWTEERALIAENKKKVTSEFELKIENGKQKEVSIKVYDRVPKSTNEAIMIELISPEEVNEEGSGVVMDRENILQWTKKMNAEESLELLLKYSVTSPKSLMTVLDEEEGNGSITS